METGDRSRCEPRDTVYSNLSRDMLNQELPSLSPVSIAKGYSLNELLFRTSFDFSIDHTIEKLDRSNNKTFIARHLTNFTQSSTSPCMTIDAIKSYCN